MKIMIAYPPLPSEKGVPLLGQNRQFQWFNAPTYIYPVIPAQAATILKENNYEVVWADGIAERKTPQEYLDLIEKEKPDLIMIETKTPVIKRHWKFINEVKRNLPKLLTVLVGDHVTALPEESFEKSQVDFVLTGGDYDFLLLNLVKTLQKSKIKLPISKPISDFKFLTSNLEPGIYWRSGNQIKNSGKFLLNHDLNKLPFIDRELTKWQLYAYKNGNYKRTPGTYIMAGRDCWWRKEGGCKFCAWSVLYPQYRTRSVENVLDEIGELIEKYRIKEIMDDTGTFPVGKWLRDFCHGMILRGYNKKIYFDCNMRAGILTQEDYDLLSKAGFRFLLYGLESANERTLKKINKGIPAGAIIKDVQMAKEANRRTGGHLEPHVTCMVGYPWETKEEAEKTVSMTRMLFDKGLIDSLQATIVIPYPGTALFKECDATGLLKTKDWERYDMREGVMKTEMSNGQLKGLTQSIYKSFLTPRFILRKLLSLRSWEDFIFLFRAARAVLGHLKDFTIRSSQ